MSARQILMDILELLDHDAWEACCISDWDMTDLVDEVDRLLDEQAGTISYQADRLVVRIGRV